MGATLGLSLLTLGLTACNKKAEAPKKQEPAPRDAQAKTPEAGAAGAAKEKKVEVLSDADLRERADAFFDPLPKNMDRKDKPSTEAQIRLGHTLYFDPRLSKNQKISCNSCHMLDKFGVDNEATSPGHADQRGDRNSPTVYNAALHITQFWDGRAADVEEQAKGPVLNPVEMAMKDEASVEKVLRSIPGYKKLFEAAFGKGSKKKPAITYDRMAQAIGAFERQLVTPAPFDRFLGGDDKAIDAKAKKGLTLFMEVGCTTCHTGASLGGGMYQKLGLIKPYKTKDEGRFALTKKEADRFVFKVPGLRNVEKTAPYLHDGSVKTLPEMVTLMARHQTVKGELKDDERDAIVAFLHTLTGELPKAWIQAPPLPKSGRRTPKPVMN